MGKKGKSKKNKTPEKPKKSLIPWIVAAVVVIAVALAVSGTLPFIGSGKETGKSFNLKAKETRPVLDPSMFTGQTRLAYAAARKYPDVLNEVYCYCYCDEPPFHHKTLLSCFTDRHGAG